MLAHKGSGYMLDDSLTGHRTLQPHLPSLSIRSIPSFVPNLTRLPSTSSLIFRDTP